MRYWHPFPEAAFTDLENRGAEQYLVVPTYPQYSCATNGATLGYVLEGLKAGRPRPAGARGARVAPPAGLPGRPGRPGGGHAAGLGRRRASIPPAAPWSTPPTPCPRRWWTAAIPTWTRSPPRVDAVHALVRERLAALGHADVAGGRRPAAPRRGWPSRAGSAPSSGWAPSWCPRSRTWPPGGCRHLCVQPVSFTCEHIETLMELDIELREDAAEGGHRGFPAGRRPEPGRDLAAVHGRRAGRPGLRRGGASPWLSAPPAAWPWWPAASPAWRWPWTCWTGPRPRGWTCR